MQSRIGKRARERRRVLRRRARSVENAPCTLEARIAKTPRRQLNLPEISGPQFWRLGALAIKPLLQHLRNASASYPHLQRTLLRTWHEGPREHQRCDAPDRPGDCGAATVTYDRLPAGSRDALPQVDGCTPRQGDSARALHAN